MREIKTLKFQEPHKFKRKANEDQYKFNLKLAETFDSAKSTAEKSNLEKVKSDLEEGEKLLVEWQKHILLADKSEFGWSIVEEYKQHNLADDSEDEKCIYVLVLLCHLERRRSLLQWLRSKDLHHSAGQFRLQVPNPKLSPTSQPLAIVFLPHCPNIGTCFACGKTRHWRAWCPLMTKQSSSQTP